MRTGSHTEAALRHILDEIQKKGISTEELKLNLPFFLGREEKTPESVAYFRQKIREASGLIVATPNITGA